ncbi:MAG: GNAT family N-acetyltransferase [Gammaproteobacteria bacterium]|nr:GNAT family N-acetyltransferase [Gammaproteobacteria bacterium]
MDNISIHCDKNIATHEYASLMAAVGWGQVTAYDPAQVLRSLQNYPFVAHARWCNTGLIGYISAFSDGAMSTFIGELVVHPEFQRRGIGTRLLQTVEVHFAGIPVYVKPFLEAQAFFLRNGYFIPKQPMTVLVKRNVTTTPAPHY